MSRKHKMRENYYIRVGKDLVPVSQEVYEAYYEMENRERYLRRLDRKQGLIYFSSVNGNSDFIDCIADSLVDIEKVVITGMMIEELKESLCELNTGELELLTEIYFNEKPIRQLAREQKISDTALRKRRDMILKKLYKKINY